MRSTKFVLEFLVLAIGSIAAGFFIAVIVHYVSFGIRGDGFGAEALGLALVEGGTSGSILAIPTGVIIYYGILKRRVGPKQIAIIVLGSVAGGILFATGSPLASIFVIPLWTIAIAVWLKRQSMNGREPATRIM